MFEDTLGQVEGDKLPLGCALGDCEDFEHRQVQSKSPLTPLM